MCRPVVLVPRDPTLGAGSSGVFAQSIGGGGGNGGLAGALAMGKDNAAAIGVGGEDVDRRQQQLLDGPLQGPQGEALLDRTVGGGLVELGDVLLDPVRERYGDLESLKRAVGMRQIDG